MEMSSETNLIWNCGCVRRGWPMLQPVSTVLCVGATARSGFCDEASNRGKILAVAEPEDVVVAGVGDDHELPGDGLEQGVELDRGLQRDQFIALTVDDQRGDADGAHLRLVGGHELLD